jgi:hypothetical protein
MKDRERYAMPLLALTARFGTATMLGGFLGVVTFCMVGG